jgi:arylsulfatase A-like enzyme
MVTRVSASEVPGEVSALRPAGAAAATATGAGHPAGASVGLLLTGVWAALAVGWLDVAMVGVRKFVLGDFVHRSAHVVWMAPAAYLLMFVPPAAVLALLSRRWPRLVTLRTGTFILLFPASLGILVQLLYQRIHAAALLALALGIAFQAARLAGAHAPSFSRMVRRTTPVLALAVVAAGAGVGIWRTLAERASLASLPSARTGATNVLFIILDTVRSANLGLYGYQRPTTPRLERFATRGVVFDQAISPSSWTLPSHASMFTGREPRALSAGWLTPLDGAVPTIAEVLRGRGYATAGFVANLQYGTYETGLDRGFIRYSDYPISLGQIFMHSGLGVFLAARRALRTLVGTDEVLGRRNADRINADFFGWLDGVEGRPFFAFLNYYDAHDPYLPPDEFFRKLTGRERPGRLSPLRRLTVRERREGVRPADLRLEIDSYDAAIAYLDDRIGRLLDDLERRGILDNTVVVIASDHGEEFGEHGVYYHGHSLYLPSLHVPLIVAYPGGPAGLRVSEPVSLTDIAPTIAQLAGIEETTGLGGRSLAPQWARPEQHASVAGGRTSSPVRSELEKGVRLPDWYPVSIGDMTSVVADGLHYIRNGDGREELFDLGSDPHERHDVARQAAARVRLATIRALVH